MERGDGPAGNSGVLFNAVLGEFAGRTFFSKTYPIMLSIDNKSEIAFLKNQRDKLLLKEKLIHNEILEIEKDIAVLKSKSQLLSSEN